MIPSTFTYSSLIEILRQKTPCVLATVIQTQGSTPQKTGQQHLPGHLGKGIDPVMDEMLNNTRTDPCHLFPSKAMEPGISNFAFLESVLPKPSPVIAGAGHIGQSLAQLGKFLGFQVTLWDDRSEYADQAKIPVADVVLSGSVDSSLEQINSQNDTYLVIVTRGHKSDSEVLRKFIGSGVTYVGMIGSKAKVSQLKSSFLENKWATAGQRDRIFTPIGLDIGAQSVDEIALSIAAQLVKVRNKRNKNDE